MIDLSCMQTMRNATANNISTKGQKDLSVDENDCYLSPCICLATNNMIRNEFVHNLLTLLTPTVSAASRNHSVSDEIFTDRAGDLLLEGCLHLLQSRLYFSSPHRREIHAWCFFLLGLVTFLASGDRRVACGLSALQTARLGYTGLSG